MDASSAGEKATLRAVLRARRVTGGDLRAASAAVCRRLARLPELAAAGTVLGYAAAPAEIDIDAALRALAQRGATLCLPWVDGDRLRLGVISDLDHDLEFGWRDLREPRRERRREIRPAAVGAAIVPGVGFDHACNRLGQGGGHFDRLLGQLRRGVPVIGVTFDECLVEALPVEAHDRPVDVVVTPTRTVRSARL